MGFWKSLVLSIFIHQQENGQAEVFQKPMLTQSLSPLPAMRSRSYSLSFWRDFLQVDTFLSLTQNVEVSYGHLKKFVVTEA